jgi:predicted SAM-dependent methyltransferase
VGLKLNLGCGKNLREGFVNVDKYGEPDLLHDLETFPWPWKDSSVQEVLMIHVLEHLGQRVDVYLRIIKELYRICIPDARILIVVPHFRHDSFFDDPTHVRAITPMGLMLFSQDANRTWIERGESNSPLGLSTE